LSAASEGAGKAAAIPSCSEFDECVAIGGMPYDCCYAHMSDDTSNCALCLKSACILRSTVCRSSSRDGAPNMYCEVCYRVGHFEEARAQTGRGGDDGASSQAKPGKFDKEGGKPFNKDVAGRAKLGGRAKPGGGKPNKKDGGKPFQRAVEPQPKKKPPRKAPAEKPLDKGRPRKKGPKTGAVPNVKLEV